MTAGDRIRAARLSIGMTQNALGEKCGIAEPTIRRYELGKLNPKPSTLQKIADATNLPLSFFQSTQPFEDLGFLGQFKGVILSALEHSHLFSWNNRALNEIENYEFWKAIADHIISITLDANDDLSIQYGATNKETTLEKIKRHKDSPVNSPNLVAAAFGVPHNLHEILLDEFFKMGIRPEQIKKESPRAAIIGEGFIVDELTPDEAKKLAEFAVRKLNSFSKQIQEKAPDATNIQD